MDKRLNKFIERLKKLNGFELVRFAVLFGSRAEGRNKKDSDYDIAVYFLGDGDEKYRFLIDANFDKNFDVKIFQDLPLFIKKDVLRGRVLYSDDLAFVYDVAYETIKEFDHFKRYYHDYMETRKLRSS